MRRLLILLLGALTLFGVQACGKGDDARETAGSGETVEIAPSDFALVPCGSNEVDRPCALIVAGGKRILLGAPAGVTGTLVQSDLAQLDGVLLFSLRAGDIEGVDEVRNSSWQAGRAKPLLIVGPRGVEAFSGAINQAYERSDALAHVEAAARGGFDAAVLTPHAVTPGLLESVINTGDLQIASTEVSTGHLAYVINYAGRTVIVQACGAGAPFDFQAEFGLPADRQLNCQGDDMVWPFSGAPVFIIGPAILEDTDP